MFGLSPGGQGVYRYNGSGMSWTQVGGPASAIYGGGYGLVATNPSNGNLWRYLGSPNNWEQIGGPGAAFTVTSDTVFGLSPGDQGVYRYNGSGIVLDPGRRTRQRDLRWRLRPGGDQPV